MAKLSRKNGSASNILRVKILDSTSTSGAPLAGLTFSSTGMIISTIASNEATPTIYTVAAGNVETISTLGTFAAPTTNKCRFKEVDATNHKGLYEIQIADARFAVASARSLIVTISGATNAVQVDLEIDLDAEVSVTKWNGVALATTNPLPNAAAEAVGGLFTRGTGAGQINQTANGVISTITKDAYSEGSVWIDTVNGAAGTTSYVNGTQHNPVASIADATTLATALGLKRFRVAVGSTIVLAQSYTNFQFWGRSWTLNLGGQAVAGCYFEGAVVVDVSTGTGQKYNLCAFGACTLPPCSISDSVFVSTLTMGSAGAYHIDGCYSGTADDTAPIFDFGTTGGQNNDLNLNHYSGGLEVRNVGQSGTDRVSLSGRGRLVIASSCVVAGDIRVRGLFNIENSGTPTLTATANFTNPTGFAAATFPTTVASPTNITAGTITTVTTLTGHTAQTGDSFARLGAPAGVSVSADIALIKSETGAIAGLNDLSSADVTNAASASLQSANLHKLFQSALTGGEIVDNSAFAKLVSKSVMAAFTDFDNTTDSLQAQRDNTGSAVGATISADIAAIQADTDDLQTQVGTAGAGLTAIPKTGYSLVSTGLNLVLVDGVALPKALQRIGATTAGKLPSGAGTTTEAFIGLDSSTTRVTFTVDSSGNRTAVTYNDA
jgi:hypothetical protein